MTTEELLRVAQLMRSASRENAGVFAAASGLSRKLAKQPHLLLKVFAGEDEHSAADLAEWNGLAVHTSRILPPAVFSYTPGLIKAVQDFHPHIVHQHGLWTYPSFVSRYLARRNGARIIISIHGMLTTWALQHRTRRKRVAFCLYERKNLESADCIHALTSAEMSEIRAMDIKTPICVIRNGVKTNSLLRNQREFQRDTQSRTLLYVGRLHKIKGLVELLEGWALYRAHAKGEAWRLRIVGWGEAEFTEILKAVVRNLGIDSTVEFAGPKFGDELLGEYSRADGFVLTSHSEAMPMAVLEAWASELPVIMTQGCGLPEGLVSGAAIKTSITPRDIAAAMATLTALPQRKREEMGRAGRALVEERYSWQTSAQAFADVYDWLAGRGAKPECVHS